MKKTRKLIGISLLVVIVILVISKFILAQPEAKKICFYPKNEGSDDVKLSALKSQAICFEDKQILEAFHSANTAFYKFTIWHGGIIGTFIDKKDKVHLIRVSFTDGVIADDTNNKIYTIEDSVMQRKWYDAVNIAMSKKSGLE